MKKGRPTKYKPEYIDQLIEYFDIESGYEKEVENSKGQMQSLWIPNNFPTFAGFACQIGVHRETLRNWCEEHQEFFAAYKKAEEHQERLLVENGLRGSYNPAFAIFTAKNVIGWRDKREHVVDANMKITVAFEE